jgi:hypothetical protein
MTTRSPDLTAAQARTPAPDTVPASETSAPDTTDVRTPSAEANQHRAGPDSRPSTSWIHPRVYTIVIALTAWFALAVWSFAGQGIVNYLLFVVSGIIFVAVALTLILSRVGQDGPAAPRDENVPSLREWAKWEYETWAGKVSGAEAAVQILLPIAAAAIGMTAIGIIFYFSAPVGA